MPSILPKGRGKGLKTETYQSPSQRAYFPLEEGKGKNRGEEPVGFKMKKTKSLGKTGGKSLAPVLVEMDQGEKSLDNENNGDSFFGVAQTRRPKNPKYGRKKGQKTRGRVR